MVKTIVLILLCFVFGTGHLAHAGVVVQPDSTEIMVEADKAVEGTLQVTNDAQETVQVKVQLEDWLKQRTGKTTIPVENWLSLKLTDLELGPKETKTVQYTINVPQGAGAELVAMAFFGTASPQGNFNVTSRYGVSIYATVSSEIKLDCNLLGIDVARNFITTDAGEVDKGIIFTLNVENKGNVHIRPTGTIVINSGSGQKYEIAIARDFPVYPGAQLKQVVMWNKVDISPGKYSAAISLDYGRLYNLDGKIEKTIYFSVNPDRTVTMEDAEGSEGNAKI